jgi:hypothetical protein
VALAYSEAFGHGLDAMVRSRQQLVPDRERFGEINACMSAALKSALIAHSVSRRAMPQ